MADEVLEAAALAGQVFCDFFQWTNAAAHKTLLGRHGEPRGLLESTNQSS